MIRIIFGGVGIPLGPLRFLKIDAVPNRFPFMAGYCEYTDKTSPGHHPFIILMIIALNST
jgi:hypothetical protein